MLNRILWISVAGIALIAGLATQDGDRIFGWSDREENSSERIMEDRVNRAIDRSFDKMPVVRLDGREVEVPDETKRAMAAAVGRLVKAETDVAIARVSESSDEELQAARARREKARADVERLKAQIKGFERGAKSENDALREEIRREVREDVRETVRDAVGS